MLYIAHAKPAHKEAIMSQVTVLPKITVKDIKADPKKVLGQDAADARLPLARIYGIASGTKIKTITDPKDGSVKSYEQLNGSFRAVNAQTGERYQSGVLYLPEGIHELLAEPLKAAKAAGDEAEITFAFDVFSEKRTNAAGYGYGATILGEPAQDDSLARLEGSMTEAGAPALPSPEEVAARKAAEEKAKADAAAEAAKAAPKK